VAFCPAFVKRNVLSGADLSDPRFLNLQPYTTATAATEGTGWKSQLFRRSFIYHSPSACTLSNCLILFHRMLLNVDSWVYSLTRRRSRECISSQIHVHIQTDTHNDGQNDQSHNFLQCSPRSIGGDNNIKQTNIRPQLGHNTAPARAAVL